MRHRNSVFHDLLKLVPWTAFTNWGGARDRRFGARFHDQAPVAGAAARPTERRLPLREIEATMASHQGRLYHSGAVAPKRSTFADANRAHDFRVFSDLFEAMLAGASRGARRS